MSVQRMIIWTTCLYRTFSGKTNKLNGQTSLGQKKLSAQLYIFSTIWKKNPNKHRRSYLVENLLADLFFFNCLIVHQKYFIFRNDENRITLMCRFNGSINTSFKSLDIWASCNNMAVVLCDNQIILIPTCIVNFVVKISSQNGYFSVTNISHEFWTKWGWMRDRLGSLNWNIRCSLTVKNWTCFHSLIFRFFSPAYCWKSRCFAL